MTAIQRLNSSIILFNHTVAERLGLGASDAQFLTLLQVNGPMTPGQLAAKSNLKTGTVTGVLDRLERAGFVRRDRAADDRRKVIVSIDDAAVYQQMEPMYRGQAENLTRVLAGFSDVELDTILRFLTAVNEDQAAG
jgi:DNA-binding MarR family transcriptional regulator